MKRQLASHTSAFIILVGFSITCFAAEAGFWQRTNGPGGWLITSMVATEEGAILAGSMSSGVFASYDNGTSWRQSGLMGQAVTTLYRSEGRIYAGLRGAIARSQDGGVSWVHYPLPAGAGQVRAMAVQGARILAGTAYGLYSSADGGVQWRCLVLPGNKQSVTALALDREGLVLAATAEDLYRLAPGGEEWQSVGLKAVRCIGVDAGGNYLAATFNAEMYRSRDKGLQWSLLPAAPAESVASLAVDATGTVYAATSKGVYSSGDEGRHWACYTSLNNVQVLLAGSAGELFAGTCTGAYRSENGGANWLAVNRGLHNTIINTMLTLPDGTLLAGAYSGIHTSVDGGSAWTLSTHGPQTAVLSLLAGTNGVLYAGSCDGVYRSLDGGSSWDAVGRRFWEPLSRNSRAHIVGLEMSSAGVLYAANFSGGVYHSTDGGETWGRAPFNQQEISAIALDAQDNIFVGTGNGVYMSRDGGIVWRNCSNELSGMEISALLAGDNGRVYAATHQGVYSSDDLGGHWHFMPTGDEQGAIYCLAAQGSNMYAAGYGAVFHSVNYGETWQAIGSELSRVLVKGIVPGNDGGLYVATGAGVYKSRTAVHGYTGEPGGGGIVVEQVYPNPAHEAVSIVFQVDRTRTLTMDVYNTLGKRVARIAGGEFPAGRQSVRWQLDDVESGTYVYRLDSEGETLSGKVLVRK